jgi:hypothetical protein
MIQMKTQVLNLKIFKTQIPIRYLIQKKISLPHRKHVDTIK